MSNLAYHRGVVRESVIMATSKDGKEFDLAKEPIVSGPPNGEDSFFRDLKVSRDPTDNEWKMAVGATNGENGQVQLYESDDLDSWFLMRALLVMLCSGTRTKQVVI
ncbi:hypothetical protein DER46DRAFT_685517 [Fusarium sp. MPI-SDFR-AT-0072]|nr:hypothetical protein DER46DRAFT_685517 [Fusarium sp. MPI-SDFR-AT-0072]